MPWGGAPNAELLQNIVASVIRQGLSPANEGVGAQAQTFTRLVHNMAQNQASGNASNPNSAQPNQSQNQAAHNIQRRMYILLFATLFVFR